MITERRWKQICYTILAVLLTPAVLLLAWRWLDVNSTLATWLSPVSVVILLVYIWRPRPRRQQR
jgi:energy-converting hydrogenase Eha subunit C